ncbi:MAG: HEAT repeat domain-containing protein [Acidobacteria bacterium]|nr:HEAT repeat domain-containing protein [Acidobacteriota bacterium]
MSRRKTRSWAAVTAVLLGILGTGVAGTAKDEAPAPTFTHVLGRILEMEDTRSSGGGELDRLLRHREPGIRRRAALAAGRLGDPSLVPTLLDLMNDQEVEIRKMAAFALGLTGDVSAVDRLIAALGESEPVVRGRAAEALGRIGERRAADAVADFVLRATPRSEGTVTVRGDDPGSADDPWIELRLGLLALAALEDRPAARRALLVSGRPRFDWWVAAWVAMRLEDPALRPVLLNAARSDDAYSRTLAARGLGTLEDPSSFDVLASLVRDENEGVAAEALRSLGAIGDERGRTLAASLLTSPSDVLRRQALLTLAALPAENRLRARIVPRVGDSSPWIRAAALAALAHTDRDNFALVLSGMDPDPVWWVRASLATALGELGDAMSVGILHSMLEDEDPRVLPAVLAALHRARGGDSVDTLKRYLEHSDLGVRAAAADSLSAQPTPGLSPALLAAWKRGLGDGELAARLATVGALAAQSDGRAPLVEIAERDPSRAVRSRAAAALRELGAVSVPDPGPEAVDRPALDYRVAMAPLYPLPGVSLFTPRAFLQTRHGVVEIHLDVVEAPLTSASFIRLARRGFYDGLTFHDVEPGFLVQGGDPRGDGYGGPGYALRGEVTRRPFGRGSVGLARAGPDSGGSRFFIALSPQPHLDGRFTRFGSVVSGLDVLDRIRPGDVIERIEVWTGE